MVRQVRLDHEEILLDVTAQSVRYGGVLRDRSGRLDNINSQEVAHESSTRKEIHGMIDDLDNVAIISPNVHASRKEALLYMFEDNVAVIKMIIN